MVGLDLVLFRGQSQPVARRSDEEKNVAAAYGDANLGFHLPVGESDDLQISVNLFLLLVLESRVRAQDPRNLARVTGERPSRKDLEPSAHGANLPEKPDGVHAKVQQSY